MYSNSSNSSNANAGGMEVENRPLDNFTMIANFFARDPNVTPRACRLYVYLMSHATGWKVSVKAAQNATGMGRGTVYAAINDLRKLGYIRRIDLKDENGQFSGNSYKVLGYPLPEHERDVVGDKADARVPESGKRCDQQETSETPGGNRLPESGMPLSGIPQSGTHKKNNPKKINPKNNKDLKDMRIPDGKRVDLAQGELVQTAAATPAQPSEQKKPANKYPADFEEWYAQYPRKKAKGDALKAYKAARKLVGQQELVEKTAKYARYVEQSGMEPRFVPYPATWLRAAQWDDEQDVQAPNSSAVGAAGGRTQGAMDIARRMIFEQGYGQNTAGQDNTNHRELNW